MNMPQTLYRWATAFGLMAGAATALAGAPRPGVVSHVLVLSDKCEDVSSPEAWKRTYIRDGMTDQEKAIAIWKTVVKYRHQENPPGEGLQAANENHPEGNVHEPLKTFHVYGYGMCCCAAADIEGLARYIGMPARGRIINNHSVPEVWYDGAWHLLDASLMFYLQKPGPDGKPAAGPIASVDEMRADIMAWRKQHPEIRTDSDLKKFAMDGGWEKGPPLFASANLSREGALYRFYDRHGINRAGWHGWWSNIGEYNYKRADDKKKMIVYPPDTNPAWNIYDYGATMGYQLNVQLREGEKLTRCWFASQLATGLNRNNPKRLEKFLKGDMTALGMQKDMGDLAPGRVGNGTLMYDALADSRLSADAIAFDNLTLDGGKLRVTDASKAGVLVVRMPSSYVYLDGEMISKPVVGQGGTISASISLNNGLDWKPLAKFDESGDRKIDLKVAVFNKYDYRVKLELRGAGTGLDALRFSHAVQHSQAPLPLLTAGENKITFSAGAQEGTITVQGNMNSDEVGAAAAHDDAARVHQVQGLLLVQAAKLLTPEPHGVLAAGPPPGDGSFRVLAAVLGHRVGPQLPRYAVQFELRPVPLPFAEAECRAPHVRGSAVHLDRRDYLIQGWLVGPPELRILPRLGQPDDLLSLRRHHDLACGECLLGLRTGGEDTGLRAIVSDRHYLIDDPHLAFRRRRVGQRQFQV